MHIESTYPLWLILPLVALAVFVAWILYFRRQEASVLPLPVRILLGITRMILVILIGLLIISPWIRTSVDRQTKPWFILAQDNSVSIPPLKDSLVFARERSDLAGKMAKSLEDRFQIKKVTFGTQTADGDLCTYSDPVTDPGELFTFFRIFAQTHDLGGVLLTSDGVATRGTGFAEAARNFPYPVSVLASGDSTRFPDVRIQEVVTNDWVRRNTTFPVRVYYNSGDYSGAAFKLQISGPTGVLAEQEVKTSNQTSPFADFMIQAPDRGTLPLVARIIPDQPDKNQDNNSRRFTVKVIEKEGEILCLYESPHPDINAIAQALKGSNTLNINILDVSEFVPSDRDYDLIILHGLPSRSHPLEELMRKAADRQIPVLFVIAKSTDPGYFNRINTGLSIDNPRKTGEASQGVLHPLFTLFTLPEDFKNHLGTWPPLELSFETFSPDPGSQLLLNQKIMNIELTDPLISFSNSRGVKYGFICGEGIWLWRLHEFLEQQNHEYFDDLLSRMVQYLMLDEAKDRFRVIIPDELFAYSQVRINAHLLNNSLEAVNDPDVLFTVTDSSGQKPEYRMGRINDYYELYLNGFAPGTYLYTAETRFGNEVFRREGVLTMMVRPVEQREPVADFASLRSVTRSSNGRFFIPGEENALISYLDDLKPSEVRIKKEFKWYDLINIKWLLALLIILAAMEWFLRRWFGIR